MAMDPRTPATKTASPMISPWITRTMIAMSRAVSIRFGCGVRGCAGVGGRANAANGAAQSLQPRRPLALPRWRIALSCSGSASRIFRARCGATMVPIAPPTKNPMAAPMMIQVMVESTQPHQRKDMFRTRRIFLRAPEVELVPSLTTSLTSSVVSRTVSHGLPSRLDDRCDIGPDRGQ